jgi:uncharacterized protein
VVSEVIELNPKLKKAQAERTCLGCGKKQSKRLLHRLVLDPSHQPVVDKPQTAPGRGAYLCGVGCLSAATKRKAFQRAFRGLMKSLETTSLEADLQR